MRGLRHNAVNEAQISLQSKIITPYADGQIVLPDENYDALDQVTINNIPTRTVGSSDAAYGNPYGDTILIGTPTYTVSSIVNGGKSSSSAVVIDNSFIDHMDDGVSVKYLYTYYQSGQKYVYGLGATASVSYSSTSRSYSATINKKIYLKPGFKYFISSSDDFASYVFRTGSNYSPKNGSKSFTINNVNGSSGAQDMLPNIIYDANMNNLVELKIYGNYSATSLGSGWTLGVGIYHLYAIEFD